MRTKYSRIVRVGVDLAKNVMQVHAVDAAGSQLVARQFPRADFAKWVTLLPKGCVVAMEATTGCHYWARELSAMGLEPRLLPPAFVTPYRMAGASGKNDANDAEAICEAATRPRMRYVAAKSPEQQSWLVIHRLRDGYIKERIAAINRIKAILLEFGVILSVTGPRLVASIESVLTDEGFNLPPPAREGLERCRAHLHQTTQEIAWCDRQIGRHAREDARAKLAMSVLGVGPLGASALSASVGDLSQFRNGRQFSAWLGLVPRQKSSGGVLRLGRITKRGDPYLRKLLVMGARSALAVADEHDDPLSQWAVQVRQRVGWPKATVALANKNARLLWRTLSVQSCQSASG